MCFRIWKVGKIDINLAILVAIIFFDPIVWAVQCQHIYIHPWAGSLTAAIILQNTNLRDFKTHTISKLIFPFLKELNLQENELKTEI